MFKLSLEISNNPPICAGYAQNREWEISTISSRTMIYQSDKIVVNNYSSHLFQFKKDKTQFFTTLPEVRIHDYNTPYLWLECYGKQTIEQLGSKARVELTYFGCTKYCLQDCINGNVYNSEDLIVGYLNGHYLNNLKYTDKRSNISTVIWKIDPDDELFYDYFSFTNFTLTLNDPQYYTECPTDSRKRKDLKYLEVGDHESCEKCTSFLQSYYAKNNITTTGTVIKYEPKWFKKVDTFNSIINYQYNNKYWLSKLRNDFLRSENIFPKDFEY